MIKLLSLLFVFGFLYLGIFLDVTQKPKKSDIIFCLGGSNIGRIITSIKLLENNYSTKNELIYIGKKTKKLLRLKKQKNIDINKFNIIYEKSPKNTMEEMIFLEKYMMSKHYQSVLIVTDPFHSRRVDFLIKQFAKKLKGKYIIVSSNPPWWNKYYYFLNLKALGLSLCEIVKIVYNYIKYTFLQDTESIDILDNYSKKINIYIRKNLDI